MNFKQIMRLTLILSIATTIANAAAAEPSKKKSNRKKIEVAVNESNYQLITPHATPETKELYYKLSCLQGEAMLFGQHYTNVMGCEFTDWKQRLNKCDMVESVGDYPAVFGFDFGRGFDNQLAAVINAAKMGGIITISDHVPNPHAQKSYKHIKELKFAEIKSVLPDGEYHDYLVARLDQIADFASKAVIDGKKIPIIYRPWHEHTGGWFWWGSNSGTEAEYIELWQFTVEYLRDKKGVDNFIYAFSPSYSSTKDGYEVRNPGVEYFDIAGVDIYVNDKQNQAELLTSAAEVTVAYAEKHNKLAALTEFGYRNGIQNSSDATWFTETFLNSILNSKSGKRVVYALTWSNTKGGAWVPLKGELTHDDFTEFYNHPYTTFLKEWKER